jgi:hypothetical protein
LGPREGERTASSGSRLRRKSRRSSEEVGEGGTTLLLMGSSWAVCI